MLNDFVFLLIGWENVKSVPLEMWNHSSVTCSSPLFSTYEFSNERIGRTSASRCLQVLVIFHRTSSTGRKTPSIATLSFLNVHRCGPILITVAVLVRPLACARGWRAVCRDLFRPRWLVISVSAVHVTESRYATLEFVIGVNLLWEAPS